MKVRPRKELRDLKPGEVRRIDKYYDDFYRSEYTKALERDGRIMLDLYMKMTCVTMYDKLQMTEDEIYLFLGHHRELFHDQVKRVRSGEQVDYLNRRMEEIFKTKGFPQGFFDKLLGKVEPDTNVGGKTEVAERREDIENSPVDCSTPSVTDSKGERNEHL